MRTVLPPKARLVPPNAKRVFKGIIFDVYHFQKPAFDGSQVTFEMLKRPDTVAILAVREGKIVVTIEEHAEISGPFTTIPGGRHDRTTETELEAAQRELLEETGLTFKTWKLLDVRQTEPKIEHFVYFFLATDFSEQGPLRLDAPERIRIDLMDFEAAKKIPHSFRLQHILDGVSSIDELLQLPEYRP